MVLATIQVTILFIMPFNSEKERNQDHDHNTLIYLRSKNVLNQFLSKKNATNLYEVMLVWD